MTPFALSFAFDPTVHRTRVHDGVWLDRHWHHAAQPVWSRAPCATLHLDAGLYPQGTALVVELRVFAASPQLPACIHVQTAGQPDQQVDVTTPDPVTLRLIAGAPASGADHSTVVLGLDRLKSPAQMGISRDDRLLGLCLLSVSTQGGALELPLDFANPDLTASLLGGGWTPPEPGAGVWSTAKRCDLVLPGHLRAAALQAPAGLVLHAQTLPRSTEHPPLEVSIETPAGTGPWHALDQTQIALPLETAAWDNNTPYVITLHSRHIRAPLELGINADARPLGIMLQRIARADDA